jgi:CO/xanthine dehydrogenase Mo-binding subunit
MNYISSRDDYKIVGTRPVRPDGIDKVTGKAQYGADVAMAGMLVGKVLRSPHAHARILSIDTSKATALAGVKAVVTAADFPELPSEDAAAGDGAINFRFLAENCMARKKALYEGHAVACVAATSSAIADEALALIDVKYEVLPWVIDAEAAMAPGAPILHEDMLYEGKPSNIARRVEFKLGDAEAGLKEADVVVEGRYDTAAVHQGYIEPHAVIANVNPDGQALIYASTQGQFMVRSYCAKILGMDIADIRVVQAEIGGGFGGKTLVYLEPLAVALSRLSGRPVKMVMNREETFRATGPTSGGFMTVKIGARKDGTITGATIDMALQAGAYPGSPIAPALMCAYAMYDLKNVRASGFDVVSNRCKVAAYRAPGAPISTWGVESAMDDLASKLGMDPIALRQKNAAKKGTKAAYGPVFPEIGYEEVLAAAKAHPHWSAPLGPNQGRGIATGFWFNIGGDSSASVFVNEDGTVSVVSGSPDIGGSRASMAMMAAEVLGIPYEKVRPIIGDTAQIGFTGMTGGSRVTFATGMATVQAAEKVVDELKRRAAMIWDISPEAVEWKDGQAVPAGANAGGFDPLPLAAIAAKASKTGGPINAEVSINAQGAGAGFGAHICDVEVDRETGFVKVLRYTAIQDVGKAIHPSYVEGQLQGGATQGIGWALNEEYIYDKNGRMDNPGFLDYRVPVASDLPMIDTVLVEVPNLRHPFGVRGVGEVPIVPPMAAVGNAVKAATGIRMHSLPMSPPKVRAALDSGKG